MKLSLSSEFLYQLFALLIIVILVHAVYVGLIRPSADAILLQQARMSTELQNSLMSTRLLPFSSIASRLRRLVRQTALEVGKKVDLELIGADVEVDRTIIDRIVPSLEHMLRNAIDHGIGTPETRMAAGKSTKGVITIRFAKQGSEALISVGDDGEGVNIEGAYGFVVEDKKRAVLVVEVEKIPEVSSLLAGRGFTVLTDDEIYAL